GGVAGTSSRSLSSCGARHAACVFNLAVSYGATRRAAGLRETGVRPRKTDGRGRLMPRLADIAKHADVSEATVSRVLNGRPGVAQSTRQAVLTALDVLGYDRPSRLRRASAGLVGLIVPELTNPIFPAFAQVIETALVRHGFTPVLCTHTPGGVHEDDYVKMLLDRGVAGIIYVSGQHADTTTDPGR